MNKVQHLHVPPKSNNRKRPDNWFRREFLDDIKGMSETKAVKALGRLIRAYREGKRLKWDTNLEETKANIIRYFESLLLQQENKKLAEAINKAPDIYTCLCWVEAVLFTDNIFPLEQ